MFRLMFNWLVKKVVTYVRENLTPPLPSAPKKKKVSLAAPLCVIFRQIFPNRKRERVRRTRYTRAAVRRRFAEVLFRLRRGRNRFCGCSRENRSGYG